jgi:pSer/pThr/pTyr-binding forkhead associated (FHA) protein/tetratricopeptide (TPR) repeat protein
VPTLVIRNPDGSQHEQEVSGELTVGRADGNDLVLSEGGVSRNHARFFIDGADVLLEDVGSANGTWVDGEKIDAPVKVTSKSQIVIGDYEISLKVGSKPLPKASKGGVKPSRRPTTSLGKPMKASQPRSTRVVPAMKPSAGGEAGLAKRPGPQRASGPQLRGLTGPVTGQVFPLSGTMLVGRVPGVDVQVDDDSVSRRHAEVVVNGREVVLRDLGSANGTTVNGAPISEDTILNPGDIIQFGIVELMFETGGPSGSRTPVKRLGSAGGRPGRNLGSRDDDIHHGPTAESSGPPMDPRKKRLFVTGGAVVGLLFVLVLVKALTAPPEMVDPGPMAIEPGVTKGKTVLPDDPPAQIETLLAECRQYSSAETARPDWARAQAACDKIIEIEPIHEEANQLLRKIHIEKQCEENLNQAKELQASGRLEEALQVYAKVKPDCPVYFLRALSASKEPVAEVKKQAAADCKTYAANAKWENAYVRCEVYARLACQTMEASELYPPALMKLKLDGPLGKTDWRPKDPLYINFLKAREKVKPGEPMWQCPEIPAFRPPPPPPDPGKAFKEELAKRYAEPELGRALTLYFDGKFNEAPVPIQKVLENISKAEHHQTARALLLDVNNVINYYQNGVTELTNERPDKAEEPFKKALALDEKLMLGDKAAKLTEDERRREVDRRPSFVRRTIIESMSSNCYQRGKTLADRKDFRQACKIWKLGASFSRGNIDLLKALTNVCTQKARTTLEQASNCAQLQQVLDFAVDGDGFKQQAEAAMAERGCN